MIEDRIRYLRMAPMIQLPTRQQQIMKQSGARTTTQQAQSSAYTSAPQQQSNYTEEIAAVPLLRVMRLQKPELHIAKTTGSRPMSVPSIINFTNLNSQLLLESTSSCVLQSSLCLPDSLTVYVGETFTAYLGVLNTPSTSSQLHPTTSTHFPTIRRLTVVAQLQTPSQRHPLPSRLDPQQSLQHSISDPSSVGGIDVPPFSGVDTIVSRKMEEPGPHILRVEVGYYSPPNLQHYQTFRKFYRFNVKLPLLITEQSTIRDTDTSCYINMRIEYPLSQESNEKQDPLILSQIKFVTPSDELIATPIGSDGKNAKNEGSSSSESLKKTAIDYFDDESITTIIVPGGRLLSTYRLQTNSSNATVRGIAVGDVLGQLQLTWQKAMGEQGVLTSHSSPTVFCPAAGTTKYNRNQSNGSNDNQSNQLLATHLVSYRSGLSVDVSATAAKALSVSPTNSSSLMMITVEPIDPPLQMKLYEAVTVPLLVVNHGRFPCTLQVQFNVPMKNDGFVVSGTSHVNIGTVDSHGGSKLVTNFKFVPVQAGLITIQHCTIMDVLSGLTQIQPPLWNAFCSVLLPFDLPKS